MSLLTVLTLSPVDGGAMRVALFIMVLVAVALILTGCVVALLTLYNQRKSRAMDEIYRE